LSPNLVADPALDRNGQDPDGDGFTNLEEWQGHTNPTDRNSHPEYYTKLKLISASEEPFRLIFSSWMGDTYQINTIDFNQPTQFLKVGDTIKVRCHVLRDGTNGCLLGFLKMKDGSVKDWDGGNAVNPKDF